MNHLFNALSTSSFMPHGMCYAWRPDILWLNVGSDALIVTAYLSIPFALLTFVRRRRDLEFKGMFVLFAAFIVLCAITHFMGIWVVWNPDYGVQGLWKLATAMVSMTTAIILWPIIPKALALPSPAQLAQANEKLAEARDRLEARVTERTAELEAKQQELIKLNQDLKKRDNEITRLMLTDPLTGVANRRRLDQVLQSEIQRHLRYGNPLCVAYVDIDDFKAINDHYGHQTGDQVLKDAGSAMNADLRANDLVVRQGGDEFVLVLPETPGDKVLQLLDRTRAALSKLVIPGTDTTVGASIGVAIFKAGESSDDVLKRADAALYEAKHTGKNKVVMSD